MTGTPWCQPLDGFRAICACLAVTGHTFLASGLIGSSAPLGVLGILVALFFAISGYVLYQPFLEADVRRQPRPSAGGFYVRRLLRIYPLFALALTTYLIVLPEVRPDNAWGYVRCYLFLQIFGRELSGFKGIGVVCGLVALLAVVLVRLPSIAAEGDPYTIVSAPAAQQAAPQQAGFGGVDPVVGLGHGTHPSGSS